MNEGLDLENRLTKHGVDVAGWVGQRVTDDQLARMITVARVERRDAARTHRRFPIGLRWSAGLCAAVAVAAAVVLIAHMSETARSPKLPMRIDVSGAVLLTAAPVRLTAAFVQTVPGSNDVQLVVFDSHDRHTRTLGAPAQYRVVRVSPAGDSVAALVGDTVRFFDVATGAEHYVALPPQTCADYPVWAPDGKHVAIAGERVFILNDHGSIVSSADAPAPVMPGPAPVGPHCSVSSGGWSWSPDGSLFADAVNGQFIVESAAGGVAASSEQSLTPGYDPANGVVFAGWRDDHVMVIASPRTVTESGSGPVATVQSPVASGWEVRVSGSGLTSVPGTALSFVTTAPGPLGVLPQSVIDKYVPNGAVIASSATADRRGDMYEIVPGRGGAPTVSSTVVVMINGAVEAVRLPQMPNTRDVALVDAALGG